MVFKNFDLKKLKCSGNRTIVDTMVFDIVK